jgi:hypothetical protein
VLAPAVATSATWRSNSAYASRAVPRFYGNVLHDLEAWSFVASWGLFLIQGMSSGRWKKIRVCGISLEELTTSGMFAALNFFIWFPVVSDMYAGFYREDGRRAACFVRHPNAVRACHFRFQLLTHWLPGYCIVIFTTGMQLVHRECKVLRITIASRGVDSASLLESA